MRTRVYARWLSLLLVLLALPWISTSAETQVYRSVETDTKKIALTFDDGPHPTLTPRILEILKKYDVKATFFMVGENVVNYPESARFVVQAGHEIGNHTYSHRHVSGMNEDTLKKELALCEDALFELCEYRTHLFRPPEGAINDQVREIAGESGYRIVLWSIDTEDWRHTPPHDIVSRVTREVRDGDIILMHDYIGRGSPTPEALKKMIPALIARGYRFVLVSELLSIGTAPSESEVNR